MAAFKRILASCLAAGALLGADHAASAGTTTAALAVSVTVAPTCSVAANPLLFGTYYPGSGGLNANTTLLVRCSHGAAFTVAMDAGSGGGTLAQRLMAQGSAHLQYNLYTSAARTTVWGDGSVSSAVVAGVGKGLASTEAVAETVYGTLPDSAANQHLPPGLYSDTVLVTISY
ncbi:MAG: spore coat protein U domain-containing protein [Gammaproteobacteria bacterium]|nr:spore coat protein U domain-containing protein [Gammaproteobacteria bacterium]